MQLWLFMIVYVISLRTFVIIYVIFYKFIVIVDHSFVVSYSLWRWSRKRPDLVKILHSCWIPVVVQVSSGLELRKLLDAELKDVRCCFMSLQTSHIEIIEHPNWHPAPVISIGTFDQIWSDEISECSLQCNDAAMMAMSPKTIIPALCTDPLKNLKLEVGCRVGRCSGSSRGGKDVKLNVNPQHMYIRF